ncbi:AI-2E family transporter [uncultured Formosa sp.]|uniref:AI-2E family transporter n=1 Tax=uncultured Formosa sp. TaxID=255435 RepID=UPI002613F157|nr:AI-2E family transporter [uncultured Formosa sp.]
MLNDRRTTNFLLLIIVIPLVFYLLKILSFIFVPLIFSMFIALLFLPIMRWLTKRKLPNALSIVIIVLIILVFFKLAGDLIQLSSKEILSTSDAFIFKAEQKIKLLISSLESFFGTELLNDDISISTQLLDKDTLLSNFGPTVNFIRTTLTMVLMTAFFVVLWLAESINVHKLLNNTILRQKHTSVKTFMKIEKDLIKFIKVKVFVSLLTGIGTGLACYAFDVSFPIFWGLFAFIINFIQMVGSFATVILLSIFAFVEIEVASTLIFFILSITGVQVLFGAILEPVFMGKSFSINIITVLVMLMLWGFIWGIPGLIMAIPITVFVKIILEQFPSTKLIASILSKG